MRGLNIALGMVLAVIILLYGITSLAEKTTSAQPTYTIGVVFKAMDSEHWQAVRSAMQQAAKAEGIRLIIIAPENEAAVEEQNTMIRDLINNNIDGLIVSPVNDDATSEWIALAQKKQLPVLTLDEHIADLPYVGSDNYQVGQMAAAYLANHLPDQAKVAILSGNPHQSAHTERVRGFTDYLQSYTNCQIVAASASDTKYRQAAAESNRILTTHPNLDGFFVTSALMTLGTIDTTNTSTHHIAVVGVDTQNDALMAIKNGRLDGMVSQDAHEIGQLAIKTMLKMLRHEPYEKNNYIENILLTPENAEQYLSKE